MNTANRLGLALVALVVTAAPLTAATTPLDLFLSLEWPARLEYIQDASVEKWPPTAWLEALRFTDGDRIETGSDTLVATKRAVALRLIRLLAAHPYPEAAPTIDRIVGQYKDPVLRGEGFFALAKLGYKKAGPDLIRALEGLNHSPNRQRGEEIEAAYLVQGLGILGLPEAFRTVAAASLAWYTPASGVRPLARRTLELLGSPADPQILALIETDPELELREGLFETLVARGDEALTGQATAAVLTGLMGYQPVGTENLDRAERLTLAALVAAQKIAAPPASLIAPLRSFLRGAADRPIKVQAVQLLARMSDPAALELLIETLDRYNSRQKSGGNTPDDFGIVRELFGALAQSGRAEARRPLDDARFVDYTPGLVREAQAALDQLPRE